jgi:hypothetical protein
MIATQQIKSTISKPISLDEYESINVLKWNNSKWKNLCPYLLKTDGNEVYSNQGGILFENFYQGCKNIQKVFNYYIEYDERPERYKRGVDLQKLQTAIVPSNCS